MNDEKSNEEKTEKTKTNKEKILNFILGTVLFGIFFLLLMLAGMGAHGS